MRHFIIAVGGALLIGISTLSMPAEAQLACGSLDDVIEQLQRKFAQVPISIGLVNNNTVLQVFASAEGTWTIVMTQPSGVSCVIAAGEAWEKIESRISSRGLAAKIAGPPVHD